MTEHKQKLI
jgi:hypothetical protein